MRRVFNNGISHVSKPLDRVKQRAEEAKFFSGNVTVFSQYFDDVSHYTSLIEAGNFDKIKEIIRLNSDFSFEKWLDIRNMKSSQLVEVRKIGFNNK